MANSVDVGRTYEDFVIEHVVRPVVGNAFLRPVDVHGFKVDIGLTDSQIMIECKNRLDSHQSHRTAAVAFSLRHIGWRGYYLLIGPTMPAVDTTDRTVLDCALTSGVIHGLLLTGDDPTSARCALAALLEKRRT